MPFKRYVQRYRLDLDSAVANQESDVGSGTQPARFTNRFGHNQAAGLVDGSSHGNYNGTNASVAVKGRPGSSPDPTIPPALPSNR